MHFKRHELKYYLNDIQISGLSSQLSSLMDLDQNCTNLSGYRVRSLYFDSLDDECLYEKQSGLLERKKIRLRTYGDLGTQAVKFEIKSKCGQLVRKDSALIDRDTAQAICCGDYALLLKNKHPVLDRIYSIFTTKGYRPRVIVEYQRTAFVSPISNIRITFDKNLYSNINHLDLFSPVKDVMPVIIEGKQILEIKYDQFIPKYMSRVLSGINAERMAISKYTLARRFHKTHKWEDN
ncbi:MAG: polyphosphate polymerase domain-containing protein [Gammaproteobacteria bacterium]|nr:polyphosphate polymerase domain-containing protein [Gammaproteobacteria bacterium]